MESLGAKLQHPSTLHLIQEGQRLYKSTVLFHPHTFLSRNMKRKLASQLVSSNVLYLHISFPGVIFEEFSFSTTTTYLYFQI